MQVRLWGSDGQSSLARSRILLVGADAAGSEALKNLVLPGVGSFTIMDHRIVTQTDLGSNFFVDESSIGQSKAKVVQFIDITIVSHVIISGCDRIFVRNES